MLPLNEFYSIQAFDMHPVASIFIQFSPHDAFSINTLGSCHEIWLIEIMCLYVEPIFQTGIVCRQMSLNRFFAASSQDS